MHRQLNKNTDRPTSAFEFLADSPLNNMAITRHRHQQLLLVVAGIDSHPLQLPDWTYMTTVHSAINTQHYVL